MRTKNCNMELLKAIIKKLSHVFNPQQMDNKIFQVTISDRSNSWNRSALEYARNKRSLFGLFPTYNSIELTTFDDKSNLQVAVRVSDSTNDWNLNALKFAQERREKISAGSRIKA